MVWSRCRKLGDVLLILLCLSCAFISRVDAASRGSVPSQVNGQDPTQLNEADALVDAAFKLYERGQLEEALANGVDTILLDNMSLDDMRRAVALAKGKAVLEASGNVKLETVRAIAETGVDYISSGAITHSALNLDIGLDF